MTLRQPHHDGSSLYVHADAPRLGDTVTVFVRVPHSAGVSDVHLRAMHDGEPAYVTAKEDRTDDSETWWRADVRLVNPVTSYRFLLDGGRYGYRWLNGTGVHGRDVSDTFDFKLATFDPPPSWASDAVAYEVFPDRFAASGPLRDVPAWAKPARWDDEVVHQGPDTPRQLFGGDLPGLTAQLDHIERLGANLLYLTPFFPAESNHRYDACDFSRVDPLLGGDKALIALVEEAHRRGIRVIGDLTTNHVGRGHSWFRRAVDDASSPEADFFLFRLHPDDYVSWFDVPSLPKLDHRNGELRRRLYDGADSVVARWLRAPYALDGWRIDVANMTARHGGYDGNPGVARAIRRTMADVRADALLLAEHGHDASADLAGDGWHGTMAYASFTRPVWTWLSRPPRDLRFLGQPVGIPRLGGDAVASTMAEFGARVPWSARQHSFTLLDSHDTPRFRTVVDGDLSLVEAGVGLLMTLPGIPMVFAGDELGLDGLNGEDARRPMPWGSPGPASDATQGVYARLIGVRRSSPALRHGGLRWVHAGEDVLVYLRESRDERVLVQVARAAHPVVRLRPVELGMRGVAEPIYGDEPLRPGDEVSLPADGPAVRMWRL